LPPRRIEEILATCRVHEDVPPRVLSISSFLRDNSRVDDVPDFPPVSFADLSIPERVVMDAAIDGSQLEGVIPAHAPLGEHDHFNSHYLYFDEVSEAAVRLLLGGEIGVARKNTESSPPWENLPAADAAEVLKDINNWWRYEPGLLVDDPNDPGTNPILDGLPHVDGDLGYCVYDARRHEREILDWEDVMLLPK
jgi:hypothetical protein